MTDTNPAPETALTKFDAPTLKGMQARAPANTQIGFLPQNMGEAMEMAKLMAVSSFVPAHLRGKAGDCLAIVIQATRWEMDPFAVASKSYFVNDRPAFEAQLIHAVVNARAPLQKRLRETYDGKGPTRRCKVSGMLKGETEPLDYESPTFAEITVKNSPLWKNDPDQQLHYFAVRAWARKYVPEVLLGIYTREELEHGPQAAKDITPQPTRGDEPERTGYDLYDETGTYVATFYSVEEWKGEYAALGERSSDLAALDIANSETLDGLKIGRYVPPVETSGSAQQGGQATVAAPESPAAATAPAGAKGGDRRIDVTSEAVAKRTSVQIRQDARKKFDACTTQDEITMALEGYADAMAADATVAERIDAMATERRKQLHPQPA